ncbi:MAG: alpha/beta fold hydrolase [Actinomycetota bacterium]|nr:alpha/beta fold hydrolase [Actinomycetota bacterium]
MTTATDTRVRTLGDRIETRVQVAGDGPPLLFLHGAMGLTWDPFLDSLSERFTVYAPELPGTSPGDPDAINAVDDLWDLVLHHYDLLDGLGLDRPAVVGHSFGGMVAAEVAATNPQRVGKLVLVSPVGLWRDDLPVAQFLSMTPEEVVEIAFADPSGEDARQFLAMPEDEVAMQDAMIKNAWSQACAAKFIWPLPEKGLHKRLYRVTAPTLIIWGTEDRLAPPGYAEEFAQRIAGARVEKLDGAAHLPHVEQQARTSRLVLDFLTT